MIVLMHGAKNSACENGADRILAALSAYSYTRYGKDTLVLQFTSTHPVERVMSGKDTKSTTINTKFIFRDRGIDSLWKRVRAGSLNKEEWEDCTKSFSKISVAEVSENPEFSKNLLKDFDSTIRLLLSADETYNLVFVFTGSEDDELNEALRKAVVNGKKVINREVIVCNQAPGQIAVDGASYIIRNFDYDSVFTIKRMEKELGTKEVYPIAYNTGYKDACLNENAIFFIGTNKEPAEDNENYGFVKDVVSSIGRMLKVAEPELKEPNFTFKR